MILAGFSSASNSGVIYLVKCREHYKIGLTTSSVKARVAQLQTGNPYPLEVVEYFSSDTPQEDERRLHLALEDYWAQGEWFLLPDSLVDLRKVWFKPSSELSDAELWKLLKPSSRIPSQKKDDRTYSDYEKWEQKCFKLGKFHIFANLLRSEYQSGKEGCATKLLKENTCWAIEQAARIGEVDTLVVIYRLLVNREEFLSFGKNRDKKNKFCYRVVSTYKNRASLWMNDWLEVLTFVVFHTFLSGEDEYSGTKF